MGHGCSRISSIRAFILAAIFGLSGLRLFVWPQFDNQRVEPASSVPRTLFLLLAHTAKGQSLALVETLHGEFGPNFRVVFDSRHGPPPEDWPVQRDANETSKYRGFNKMACCTHELAITWLIRHSHQFDYVWMMENDIALTNVTLVS